MKLLITTDYMLVSLKYLNCDILIIQLLRGFNMVVVKIALWVPSRKLWCCSIISILKMYACSITNTGV